MCFSSTASLVAGGLLVPVGLVTLARAQRADRRYVALAAFPLLFGVQQILEGVVWQRIDAGDAAGLHQASLAYLFFAYFFWLFMTPFAAWRVERRPALRRAFAAATLFGTVFGLSLFAPLPLQPSWLNVSVLHHSIAYETRLIYDGVVSATALRVTYALVICLPLLASSVPGLRVFGSLVTASVLVTFLAGAYAFTSIWCFMAALLSAYIGVIVFRLPLPAASVRATLRA